MSRRDCWLTPQSNLCSPFQYILFICNGLLQCEIQPNVSIYLALKANLLSHLFSNLSGLLMISDLFNPIIRIYAYQMGKPCYKINTMNQDRPYLNRPAKSLSARAFAKSTRKPPTRRNDTLPTEPTQTRRQEQLQAGSSRMLAWPKRSGPFYKQPQQLQEENRTLKVKIHQLNSVLGKERSKVVHQKKNYSKVHERLQAEFSDEKYFDLSSKNSNLVEGVKFQYYRMKQQYEEKCLEYNQLLQRTENASFQETDLYVRALQAENKKLKSKMVALVSIEEKLANQLKKKRGEKKNKGQEDDAVYELLDLSVDFMMLEKKVVDGEEKIQKYEEKIASLKGKIKQRGRKIDFLDKLLIEKANEVHHAVLKERRMAKQLKLQTETVERLKKKVTQIEEESQAVMDMLKEKERVRFEAQRTIFASCLKEKDVEIEKLKQEVYYLTTIISYIKTSEDSMRPDLPTNFSKLSKKNSFKEQSSQFLQNLQKTLISIQGDNLNTRKRVKTLIESGFKEAESPRQGNTETLKIIQIASDSQNEVESVPGSILRQTQMEEAPDIRVPKKSNLKHSEGAVKVRPVKPSQIDSLKKELVYRFMFYGKTIDEVRELFNLNEDISLSKREKKWRAQYATLKEIKEKLQDYPFDLKQEQALLLSRYIVQDCTKDIVYYHEDNQVERTIAKSILRAFVGEYRLPVQEQARIQIKDVLGKSGRNLQSALASLAPTGFISSLKFLEICESIQVDFSQDTKNYILSRLLAKSTGGLTNLEYGLIFTTLVPS